MDTPELTYPRRWTYKIVGTDEPSLRDLVADVARGRPHEVAPSHTSAKGKYVSLRFEIDVVDQADRDTIFAALKNDPAVKMVL